MDLLVSTHSFLLFCSFNPSLDLISIQPVATGHHYGICRSYGKPGCFITMTRECNAFTEYSVENNSIRKIGEYITDGKFEDIHQIADQADGILVSNTGFNRIDFVKERLVQTSVNIGGAQSDINHVNSIFPVSDNISLAMLHNKAKGDAEILVINRNEDKIIECGRFPVWDTGCHNIFSDGTVMAYNSSGSGDFVIIDIHTQSLRKRVHFPGHTKGLSVTEKFYIIGFSEHVQREKRLTSKGYIAFLDRENYNVVKIIDLNVDSLPHPVGNVNEIRCISEADYSFGVNLSAQPRWKDLRMSKVDFMHQFFYKPIKFLRRKVVNLIRRI